MLLVVSANSPVWDEVSHLKGGLLLSRGQLIEWAFTNSFYPPVCDAFVALSYLGFGVSVFAARLVSVVFAVLSVFGLWHRKVGLPVGEGGVAFGGFVCGYAGYGLAFEAGYD